MIEQKHKRFLVILVVTLLLLWGIALAILFLRNDSITDYSKEVMAEATMKITEDRLRERVTTVLLAIEEERNQGRQEIEELGHATIQFIRASDQTNLIRRMQVWSDQLQSIRYGSAIQMIVFDNQAHLYSLFSSQGQQELTQQEASTLVSASGNLFKSATSAGSTLVYVFAMEQDVDAITKHILHDLILSLRYGEDGYVWVNEVVNYEGGDNYAIRRIHPNLKEGQYISTNDADIEGTRFYQAELEGIVAQGEIFHTYYVQKSSGDVAEKASYAALYKPYNWIVSSGDPLDTLTESSADLTAHSEQFYQQSLMGMVIFLVLLSAAGGSALAFANHRYRRSVEAYVKEETERDALTGALSRKAGDAALARAFASGEKESTLLLMGDIDNFKQVNDTYGHAFGDEVLRGVAQALEGSVRRTDQVFRWGGEEFVILFQNVTPQFHRPVAEQILHRVRSLRFALDGQEISVTISLGSAYFQPEDESYNDALERADACLYTSKRSGKDRCTHSSDN